MKRCVLFVGLCLSLVLVAGCSGEKSAKAPADAKPAAPAQMASAVQKPAMPAKAVPPPKPEKRERWDFATLPQNQWEWVFPDGAKAAGARGVSFECDGGLHELRWAGVPVEAKDYKAVRVHVTMTRDRADGKGREPVDVGGSPFLHWTWPGEAKANKNWPLGNSLQSRAYRPDKSNPYLWEFPVDKNEKWKGRIGGLALLLKVREGDGMRVDVKSVELVK